MFVCHLGPAPNAPERDEFHLFRGNQFAIYRTAAVPIPVSRLRIRLTPPPFHFAPHVTSKRWFHGIRPSPAADRQSSNRAIARGRLAAAAPTARVDAAGRPPSSV